MDGPLLAFCVNTLYVYKQISDCHCVLRYSTIFRYRHEQKSEKLNVIFPCLPQCGVESLIISFSIWCQIEIFSEN